MPFGNPVPHAFSYAGVQMYAPAASGVYGISNSREWIYIGATDDILSSLLSHLQETGTGIMNRRPSGFVFELRGTGDRSARQDRLVMEYEPVCNRQSQ
jgi:predicted GIY-YIG superfamily endonuclease